MLRSFSEFLTWRKSGAIILGEANIVPKNDLEYFGQFGERLQMMFNFEVNQHLFYAMASGDSRPLIRGDAGYEAASRDGAVGTISPKS